MGRVWFSVVGHRGGSRFSCSSPGPLTKREDMRQVSENAEEQWWRWGGGGNCGPGFHDS